MTISGRRQITPDAVVEVLRGDISGRRLAPGDWLRQEELAERFAVSRIPIRDALQQLESEGLVVIHPNRGAVVRSFSNEELREIYDLRILLESDLLRRAVRRMKAGDLDSISAAVGEAVGAKQAAQLERADRRFHEALYAPAGRPQQLAMVMKLRDSIAHYGPAEEHMQRLKRDWIDDHREIAEACARRDSGAAVRLLRHHLRVAAGLTLGTISRDPRRAGGSKPVPSPARSNVSRPGRARA